MSGKNKKAAARDEARRQLEKPIAICIAPT
jgi:hypothetical protein